MSDVIYTFNGKDITMNVCFQIRAVVDICRSSSVLIKCFLGRIGGVYC